MAELPITRGVFLCENVIVEEHTRKVSLINCFTKLLVESLPSPPQQFNVFAIFVNGNGSIPVRLAVTKIEPNLEGENDIFVFTGAFRFVDPFQELRTLIPITKLVFDVAGEYEVVLESNGEFLAQTRFELRVEGNT